MKLITLTITLLFTLVGFSQEPQRPLHNQFRDFVEFQQNRQEVERPQIERKNGKVIITMTESQFQRMRQFRMSQRKGFRPNNGCERCNNHHKPPMMLKRPQPRWQN